MFSSVNSTLKSILSQVSYATPQGYPRHCWHQSLRANIEAWHAATRSQLQPNSSRTKMFAPLPERTRAGSGNAEQGSGPLTNMFPSVPEESDLRVDHRQMPHRGRAPETT